MYIAEHYLEDFDYFLMGGDDMFYIIEVWNMFIISLLKSNSSLLIIYITM